MRKPARSTAGDRLLRGLGWLLVLVYFVAGLSYLALRHLVWPNPDYWLPRVEQAMSEAIGKPVSVASVRTGFDGLRPWFEAHDVAILDDDGSVAFRTTRVQAALSLSGLATGRLRFARLDIQAPVVRAERLDRRRLKVAGVVFDLGGAVATGQDAGSAWLLEQRRIVLHAADLEWIDRVSGRTKRLAKVDLALGSVGRRHRASLHIADAGEFGRDLDAAIEVWRPAWSRIDDWRAWTGRMYLAAGRAELPALASLAEDLRGLFAPAASAPAASALALPGARNAVRVDVQGGVAAARLWLDFERGAPTDALLRLSARDIGVRVSGAPLPLAAADIEADLRRARSGETRVRLHRASLSDREGTQLRLDGDRQQLRFAADGRLSGGSLVVGRFDARQLLEIAHALPLSPDLREPLARLHLSGTVERLGLTWDGAGRVPARYAVDARFDSLSFGRDAPPPPIGKLGLPTFERISGTLALDQAGGRVSVSGRKSVFHFPGLFTDPSVPFESLDGRADWRLRHRPDGAIEGVDVDIESVRIDNADATGEVSGRYSSGGKGDGIVDLRGHVTRADATRVARYLPLDVPADVRTWVARAVTAGNSDEARFVLRGDIEDFPYRDPATGEFRVEAALREATLAYAPGWPPIERIRGRLLFERAGMDIEVESGRVWGVKLAQTKASIAEFRAPVLKVAGSAQGPAQDLVRLMNESELRERVGDSLVDLKVSGPARLELRLDMPIEDVEATRVAGAVQLAANDALVAPFPPLEKLAGSLEFTEKTLVLRQLTGTFLGGAVRLDGEASEVGHFAARASGRTSAAGIRQLADNVVTRALEGATGWRATVEVRQRAVTVAIESDLVGIESHLPAPFAKAAEAGWPLRIESAPVAAASGGRLPTRDRLQITLGEHIRAEFERQRDPASQMMRVRRAAFGLGADAVMPDSGFAVRLDTPGIDVDAWAAVLGPAMSDETSSPEAAVAGFSLLPSQVSVLASDVRIGGKDLHEVVLGASRVGGFWRANLDSREIDGFFSWRAAPPGQPIGTLTARFDRLEIPRSRLGEVESLLDTAPSLLPELDIEAEQFVLDERALGRLTLRARNTGEPSAPVWSLERLSLDHPAATLTARGEWKTPSGGHKRSTTLDFELALRDAGQLLAIQGFPGTMRNGAGALAGRAQWVGSPLAIDYPSLQGHLSLVLGKGEFLKTEPGIAKLIGVLNLQSLRRRLAFDFRDLFAEGFAFTDVRGTAKLANGVAHTDDFEMRGVTAQVKIKGDANLVAETQDLLVEVRPELNAGLASLAYAALANPAIGLASFAAQLLLREPLQQLFAWTYEVTGSWSDPQVTTKSRPPVEAPPPPSGG